MKKLLLLLPILGLTLMAFMPTETNHELSALQEGFLLKVDNPELINHFEYNFPNYFDKISSVDAHSNQEFGTYYIIYGSKKGESTFLSLAAHDDDVQNGVYTYMDLNSTRESRLLPKSSAFFIRPCYINGGKCTKKHNWSSPICGWMGPTSNCDGATLPPLEPLLSE